MLCGILSGPRLEKSWNGGNELFDFFNAKGVVEGLLDQLGVETSFEVGSDESFCPGKQAAIVIADHRLGIVGELQPRVVEAFDISEAVYLFEINLATILPFTIGHKLFQPIPRFPAIDRDIALLVDAGVTHQQIQDIIKSFLLVKRVTVFDVYSGGQVPVGKKSLAYRITFQSPSHTLTDEGVNPVQQQILDWHEQGYHVLFEGLIVTSVWGRWMELAKKVPMHFMFLDTPLETCYERVLQRSGGRSPKGWNELRVR